MLDGHGVSNFSLHFFKEEKKKKKVSGKFS